MVASREATPLQRRETVAAFASQVFGRAITENQVIEETLEPFTLGGAPSRQELTASLTAPMPAALPEFRRHPLARWSEGEFGVEPEAGGRLRRRLPRTLTDAAAHLTEATGATPEVSRERLRELLTRADSCGATTAEWRSLSNCTSSSARAAPCMPPLNRRPRGNSRLRGRRSPGRAACSCPSDSAASAGRIIITSSAPAMARRIAPIPSAWTPLRTARRPVISCSPRWKTIGVRIASRTNGATGTGGSNRLGATACRKPCGSAPTAISSPCPAPGQSRCGGSPRRSRSA